MEIQIKSLGQYQAEARKSARYPDLDRNFWYPCLGLIELKRSAFPHLGTGGGKESTES